MTLEELDSLPIGRVTNRFVVGKRQYKNRVVKPYRNKTCDLCGATDLIKAVKSEMGGNVTLMTMCFNCAIEEIEDEV